ncbi:hypothetical protein B0A55_00920 [Friedmanniomyces simplex]|uniref:Uncharacterized protein n=1 Tax=Friedmanniomyces simplex TaxID=329884 RepID=A0A4U0XYI2_9PEZI|nr:hypothetical protein B0A55_00920 [Friedmanniomyces simplex]
MARAGTKRRSTRQAVSRISKRSIYVDPDTDDDDFAVDVAGEYAPEALAPQSPPPKRQKTAPRTRHQTRSKSVGKGKAVAKPSLKGVGKKRRLNTLGTPPAKKEFKGPSDGKIPDWASLPINVLRDIFVYASQPLHEQTRTSSANIDWLVKTARVCRAFALPSLEAYYQSPSLLTSYAPHRLLALLQVPKEKQYINYNAKVKSISIDVRRLAYSATNMGLFDITHFAEELPQLQQLEILHPIDEPPFRTGKIQHWYYPRTFFQALEEHGRRLKSWRWNRNMIAHADAAATYTLMAQTHTGKSFEYLEHLTVCDFGYDDSAEPSASQDGGAEASAPGLATSISLLPRLKDLTLISCEVLVDKFLERLPKNLERLEITNCLELTSDMLQTYLISGGSHLRELVLNHNPALNMSFLTGLQTNCPKVEVLKMDLRYYSERINSNDAQPLYDELLTADKTPTWPSTLRHLELIHLQRWAAEAAQNLFRSLVEGAVDLPDLRFLVLHSHLSIPWRQRAEFRDQWIDRLQRVYARRSDPPNQYLGSLRQFRLWKQAQAEGWDIKGSGRARTHGDQSDEEFTLGRSISHVAISPAKPQDADVEVYSDSSPEKKKQPEAADVTVRRSRRVAEASQASASASPPAGGGPVDNTSNDEDDQEDGEDEWQGQAEKHVQGLCTVVDIRIDNQRLRENQFTEGDFLDSERSGDEDWHEGNEDGSDDGAYAWAAELREYDVHSLGPEIKDFTMGYESLPTTQKGRRNPYAPDKAWHPGRNYNPPPTIYALSTAPGRAAIAVIRISGPACLDIYRALCPRERVPKPRYATVRTLYEPSDPVSQDSAFPSQDAVSPPPADRVLDASALVLYLPAPRTVTGEDVLELHVHGGPAVVRAVLGAIPRCARLTTGPGATAGLGAKIRYAEPGEFTRRAFMNDRLDLTQVEALGDILAATTEQQRRLSVLGTVGGLSKRYEAWRQQLLYARGELEALIDFSEDQHFDESPSELCTSVAEQVRLLKGMLEVHRRNAVRGELLRSGISIALLGAPNAGKSSLLNRIVGREAAIVSQEAGTTRDVVEIGIDLGGYLCRVGDTAGLRKAREAVGSGSGRVGESISQVEQEGMRRAKARAAESDVVIVVLSLEDAEAVGSVGVHLDLEIVATAAELIRTKDNVIVVLNKIDKVSSPHLENAVQQILHSLPGLTEARIYPISCKAARETTAPGSEAIISGPDAGGIQNFLQGLISHFHDLTTALTPESGDTKGTSTADPDPSIWQDSLGATERHRLLLEECVSSLDAFSAEVEVDISPSKQLDHHPLHPHASTGEAADEADIVLAAEHLRGAATCLAKITGRGGAGDVEEVLGVVFEKFCVGK